jgi:hypothetical protein
MNPLVLMTNAALACVYGPMLFWAEELDRLSRRARFYPGADVLPFACRVDSIRGVVARRRA